MKKDSTKEIQRQCSFIQVDKPNVKTVSWIPERSAKIGKRMKFKDADTDKGKEIVWEVTEVGDERKTRASLLDHNKAKFESLENARRK